MKTKSKPVFSAPVLPAPASRVGIVCGPCENPRDNAGTVICHVTDQWGTYALVMMDTGTINHVHGLTNVGIGVYQL